MKYSLLFAAAAAASATVFAGATVDPNNLPHTSESGQYGCVGAVTRLLSSLGWLGATRTPRLATRRK